MYNLHLCYVRILVYVNDYRKLSYCVLWLFDTSWRLEDNASREVFAAVWLRIPFWCGMTSHDRVIYSRRFERTCCLHPPLLLVRNERHGSPEEGSIPVRYRWRLSHRPAFPSSQPWTDHTLPLYFPLPVCPLSLLEPLRHWGSRHYDSRKRQEAIRHSHYLKAICMFLHIILLQNYLINIDEIWYWKCDVKWCLV